MVKKIVLVFVFILFFLKSFYMLDPDFGWHIKMGELILRSGIPATDPFSYTMPSFPFVDHEWGTNILMYVLYKSFGWGALSLIFSAIAVLAILIPLKFNLEKYSLFPFILASGSLLFFVGIRPQLIAWLFFGVLITIFLEKKYYEKFRFILPAFFLVWANLHGGFPIGLAVYFLYLIVNFYEKRKINLLDLSIFTGSVFITLLNPYGIRLWGEVFMQMSDHSLRWSIQEWMPAFSYFYPPVWFLFAFSVSFFFVFRKNFSIFEKLLYFCLLALGFSSIRHMALWTIVSLPILWKGLILFSEKAGKIKYGRERFEKAYKFSLGLGLVIILLPFLSEIKNPFIFNEETFYPKKAVSYLKKNPLKGNLFSEYGWGGYLIWKYPEKKIYIDGRMPSWRWEGNVQGESNYIFKDYKNLGEEGLLFEKTADKYKIDMVLLSVPSKKKPDNLDNFLVWLAGKFADKKNESLHTKLEKEGWKIIYQDEISVIYRKN